MQYQHYIISSGKCCPLHHLRNSYDEMKSPLNAKHCQELESPCFIAANSLMSAIEHDQVYCIFLMQTEIQMTNDMTSLYLILEENINFRMKSSSTCVWYQLQDLTTMA
jgi:hypothetical protein